MNRQSNLNRNHDLSMNRGSDNWLGVPASAGGPLAKPGRAGMPTLDHLKPGLQTDPGAHGVPAGSLGQQGPSMLLRPRDLPAPKLRQAGRPRSEGSWSQRAATRPISMVSWCDGCWQNNAGFTRMELLVVVVLLGFLGLLLMPVVARSRPVGQTYQCLNNQKQLVAAWLMYADDNNGRLVMQFHGLEALGGVVGALNQAKAPWAMGWIDWSTRPDNTNIDFLVEERYSKLAQYFGRNPSLLKCPSDNFLSPAQKAVGWTQRVRSVSASLGLGSGNAEDGLWNDGMYRHITKSSEMMFPGPDETFVFLDEQADSLNDPGFFSPRTSNAWISAPATYHNGAGSFSFADGHCELHQWAGSAAQRKSVQGSNYSSPLAAPGDPDIHWVCYRTQRKSTNSF